MEHCNALFLARRLVYVRTYVYCRSKITPISVFFKENVYFKTPRRISSRDNCMPKNMFINCLGIQYGKGLVYNILNEFDCMWKYVHISNVHLYLRKADP